MKRTVYLMWCAVFLSFGAVRVNAQRSDPTQYSDPRTPQGTLRSFAAALTKSDLTKAASYIADAKSVAGLDETKRPMQKIRIRYSINHLQIAVNDDTATIAFFFAVDRLPDKSTYPAFAVLRRNDSNLWEIDPARTLDISDSINPFSAFVSLMSNKRFPGEERADIRMRGHKFLTLGYVLQTFVADKGGKFALQGSQLRDSLLPYYPALDVLLRPLEQHEARVSFNTKLTNVTLKKVRFPQRTVMLYEGENGKLDFRHNGRAAVTLVAGNVRYVDAEMAKKLLLWSP